MKILNGTSSIFQVRSRYGEQEKYRKNPKYVEPPFAVVSPDQVDGLVNEFLKKTINYSYLIAIKQGDEIALYPRAQMPCWGELTYYGKGTHNPHRPGDLWFPFPDGEVHSIAIPLSWKFPSYLTEFLCSDISPFRKLMIGLEIREVSTRKTAIILRDTTVNSDVFAYFLKSYHRFRHLNLDMDNYDKLIHMFHIAMLPVISFQMGARDLNLHSLVNANPDSPKDQTYANKKGYRRKQIENIWASGPQEYSCLKIIRSVTHNGMTIPEKDRKKIHELVKEKIRSLHESQDR